MRRGFTLLEIVLAVTLATGLMGALLGFYGRLAAARRGVLTTVERTSARLHAMERMTDELRSAMADAGVGLTGEAERIEFAWRGVPAEGPPAECGVNWVRWRVGAGGLERAGGPLRGAVPADEDLAGSPVAPDIRFARFRYYERLPAAGEREFGELRDVEDGWLEAWEGGELPLAVEITLGTEPLDEQMELSEYLERYETFRRVVYLPAGGRG